MCQPVGMQSEKPFYHALTDWPCTLYTVVHSREKTPFTSLYLAYEHNSQEKNEKKGNILLPRLCFFISLSVFVQLQCHWKTNLPLFMDRLALSLLGVMVWEEWMNGYLCWRHWDAGQGSIRLAEPNHPCGQYAVAPLTLTHITLHLHSFTQHYRSGEIPLFLFQLVQHETKRHMTQILTDQISGYISQHALIAVSLSATVVYIFLIQYLLPLSDSTQAQQAELSFVLRVVVSR